MLISVACVARGEILHLFNRALYIINRGERDFEVIQERIVYLRRVYNLALKDKI